MASKVILVACAMVLFVKMGTAQLGYGYNAGLGLGLAGNGLGLAGNGLGLAGYGVTGCGNAAYVGSGGGLSVTSYSPITPGGVSIRSENTIDGPLNVCGDLPLLSAAALEGQVSSSGQVGVEYSCGNGNVGITSENGNGGAGLAGAPIGYGGPGLAGAGLNGGLGLAGPGINSRLNGLGCGA